MMIRDKLISTAIAQVFSPIGTGHSSFLHVSTYLKSIVACGGARMAKRDVKLECWLYADEESSDGDLEL